MRRCFQLTDTMPYPLAPSADRKHTSRLNINTDWSKMWKTNQENVKGTKSKHEQIKVCDCGISLQRRVRGRLRWRIPAPVRVWWSSSRPPWAAWSSSHKNISLTKCSPHWLNQAVERDQICIEGSADSGYFSPFLQQPSRKETDKNYLN